MVTATVKWQNAALKWRNLAERRAAHYVDLYRSGRWKHYYTDAEFLVEMRTADALARRWAKIAPLPEESAAEAAPPAEIERRAAA